MDHYGARITEITKLLGKSGIPMDFVSAKALILIGANAAEYAFFEQIPKVVKNVLGPELKRGPAKKRRR